MPLRIAEEPVDPKSLKDVAEKYIVFYSSIVDGKSWCPDCRDVEGLVKQTFSPADSPSAVIVYVGDRPAWKTPLNVFRADPWKLTDIPTIIKLREGVEESRLVEKDIAGGLAAFIKE